MERLLAEDSKSTKVAYGNFPFPRHRQRNDFLTFMIEVLENVNPDLSDSEFLDPEETTEGMGGDLDSDMQAIPADEDEGEEDEEEEEEGDIDEELAAELAREMGEMEEDASESEGSDESEEDEDEDEEAVQAKKLLLEEISDLQAAISRKEQEIAVAVNPLIKVNFGFYVNKSLFSLMLFQKRFEDQLKKMVADLDQKQGHREQMVEQRRLRNINGDSTNEPTPAVEATEVAERPEVDNEDEAEDEDEDADMEEVINVANSIFVILSTDCLYQVIWNITCFCRLAEVNWIVGFKSANLMHQGCDTFHQQLSRVF